MAGENVLIIVDLSREPLLFPHKASQVWIVQFPEMINNLKTAFSIYHVISV